MTKETHERLSLDPSGTTWAMLCARVILGLMVLMPGYYKVFTLGPRGHAEQFFLSGFEDSWIPTFLLLALGVTVPFVELLAGLLLVSGFQTRLGLLMEGFLLMMVTYGHFLRVPLFDMTVHIFPRLTLLLFVLVMPRTSDLISVDHWLSRRRNAE